MVAEAGGSEWPGIVSAVAAAFAVGAAVGIPYVAYRRRPKLGIRRRRDVYNRLEGDGNPWIRLLATNAKRKRAGYEARVEVVSVTRAGVDEPVYLGNPPLGWTSQVEREVTLYSDAGRPFDFGYLVRVAEGETLADKWGQPVPPSRDPMRWYLKLGLKDLEIRDQREWLAPGQVWSVRLVLGTSEGDACVRAVRVSWKEDAADAEVALACVKLAGLDDDDEADEGRNLVRNFVRNARDRTGTNVPLRA